MDKNRGKTNDLGVPRTQKIAKWTLLEPPQHPQTPKLCGKRIISITFLMMKKNFFFENHFFAIFLGFFDSSNQGFSRSGRSGDVSVPRPTGPSSVPGKSPKIKILVFCRFRREYTELLRSKNYSTVIQTPSAMS